MILKTVVTQTSNNVLKFVCSTSKADFVGDRIYMRGINFERFLKNPVFIYNHQKDNLPFGKFLSLEVLNDSLIGEVEFWVNPNDTSEWSEHDKITKSVYEMYKSGFMSAVSISTFDKEYIPNEYGGDDILECDLIEISSVVIPMNENALIVK